MFAHKNLVSVKELLDQALKEKKAIGAFNFSNMEILQAIVIAANEFNSPVILQVTESAINYMGMEYVTAMVSAACSQSKVALALHLDHGGNFEICKRCIDYGFSSVMIDKSSLAIEENIAQTKEVVAYARGFGVSVEAELGTLAGIEDNVKVELRDAYYTDPETALKFAEATGVDSLAVSIGTSHGPNKGVFASPKLDIDRLKKIKEKVKNSPLVLHGASSVYSQEVELANKYGASIKNAFGITDEDIRSSIENGIAKINVDTDIRIAFL
ncbi:MAG: class II fructose-bisphosphate aldolase, partial [Holosporales bacterium]|nr:class II fructose-bisphosphate aldolase [Holosporales bacterium]